MLKHFYGGGWNQCCSKRLIVILIGLSVVFHYNNYSPVFLVNLSASIKMYITIHLSWSVVRSRIGSSELSALTLVSIPFADLVSRPCHNCGILRQLSRKRKAAVGLTLNNKKKNY